MSLSIRFRPPPRQRLSVLAVFSRFNTRGRLIVQFADHKDFDPTRFDLGDRQGRRRRRASFVEVTHRLLVDRGGLMKLIKRGEFVVNAGVAVAPWSHHRRKPCRPLLPAR